MEEGDLFNSIFGSGVATSGYQWVRRAVSRDLQIAQESQK